MNFNSLTYIVFFTVLVILYRLLPYKLRPALLLVASYYFYMSWNPSLVFLILGTTLISYFSALVIDKYRGNRALTTGVTAFAVISSLSVLFFFKYLNFITESINSLFSFAGGSTALPVLNLILPVGISFYTFQTLSYVIDIKRNTTPVEKNFGYYALFVSFFPQLVAGPIERPENLLPQLREKHPLNAGDIEAGLRMMAVGFFKKIIIADGVSEYVNNVYNFPESASSVTVIVATVLFSLQIYGDFSGYTDIAIGSARILGIRLMKNFDRPYTAASVKEFWAKWHISLSTWFRDYLYIPLGGNRRGNSRKLLNVFLVFLISGLWHGAAWTFVIWGILHGVYRVSEELFSKRISAFLQSKGIDDRSDGWMLFKRVKTYILVCFAWIFFRANNISELGVLLSRLFTPAAFDKAALEAMRLDSLSVIRIALSVAVLVFIYRIQPDNRYPAPEKSSSQKHSSPAFTIMYVLFILAVLFAWFMLLADNQTSSFIYFQF